MGHRLRLLVDDRFVGNGIFTEAHGALARREPRWTRVSDGKEVDCDAMRVVLLGERLL